jgi:hypothetical protein
MMSLKIQKKKVVVYTEEDIYQMIIAHTKKHVDSSLGCYVEGINASWFTDQDGTKKLMVSWPDGGRER